MAYAYIYAELRMCVRMHTHKHTKSIYMPSVINGNTKLQ